MTETGWPALLAQLRYQRIAAATGDAPWLGTRYGTLPEVFRNTARPATVAASGDATMRRGLC
jgi:hypothetical protein